jgi:hypothetical protein
MCPSGAVRILSSFWMCMRNLRVFGWHSDYNSKIKRNSAMLKLMGKLLKRNVAVESVEVLRKKIKSM